MNSGLSAESGRPAARHRASSRNDAWRSSGVPPPSSRGFSTGPSVEASWATYSSSSSSSLVHCCNRQHSDRRAGTAADAVPGAQLHYSVQTWESYHSAITYTSVNNASQHMRCCCTNRRPRGMDKQPVNAVCTVQGTEPCQTYLVVLLQCDPVQVAEQLHVTDAGIRSKGVSHRTTQLRLNLQDQPTAAAAAGKPDSGVFVSCLGQSSTDYAVHPPCSKGSIALLMQQLPCGHYCTRSTTDRLHTLAHNMTQDLAPELLTSMYTLHIIIIH